MPMVSMTIEDCSAKTAHTSQLTRFPTSTTCSGRGPRPRRATKTPPAMKARLMKPQSSPHTCTETRDRP